MSLSGNLEDLRLAEILHVVGIAGRSGLLRVEARRGGLVLLLSRGRLVAARDERPAPALKDFLARAGVADLTHISVLEREARKDGRSLVDALAADGRLAPGQLELLLEQHVLGLLQPLLQESQGTFAFTLLEDVRAAEADFGALVLADGIPTARVPGVPDRLRPTDTPSLDEETDTGKLRQRVQLLVPEDAISLPLPFGARPAGSRLVTPQEVPGNPVATATAASGASRAATPPASLPHGLAPGERLAPVAEGAPRAPAHLALLAMASPAHRKALLTRASSLGFEVRVVGALTEADLALETALERGTSVVVLGHASHATVPGLELLARVRAVDRTVPFILLCDAAASTTRMAAVTQRARRLGATHVFVLPADDADAEGVGDAVAALLASLTTGRAPLSATDVTRLSGLPTGPEVMLFHDEPPTAISLPGLSPSRQASLLSLRARAIAASDRVQEIAESILEAASEWFERSILFVRSAEGLQAVALGGPTAGQTRFATRGGLVLDPAARGTVASVVSSGRPHLGPPGTGEADLAVAASLGDPVPRATSVLPVGPPTACVGALYGDDGGSGLPLADTSALASFLGEVTPHLSAALVRARLATEARRARRSA